MKKSLYSLVVMTFLTTFISPSYSQSNFSGKPDYMALGMKTPAKIMRQWEANIVAAANLLDYDLSKYSEYIRAQKYKGNLDPYQYVFSPEYFIEDSNGDTTSADVAAFDRSAVDFESTYRFINGILNTSYPGELNDAIIDQFLFFPASSAFFESVEYENGLPSIFKYNCPENDNWIDCLNIIYDSRNLPEKVLWIRDHNDESGEEVIKEIIISDYKFNDKGNWIQRRLTSNDGIIIQFREYEY